MLFRRACLLTRSLAHAAALSMCRAACMLQGAATDRRKGLRSRPVEDASSARAPPPFCQHVQSRKATHCPPPLPLHTFPLSYTTVEPDSPRFCCIAAWAGPTSSGLNTIRTALIAAGSRSTRPTRSLNSYPNTTSPPPRGWAGGNAQTRSIDGALVQRGM